MGTFGRRPALKNNDFKEPSLIKGVNDIISAATSNNWIDEKGNIDIVKVATSKNIKLEYIPMESSISGYLRQENGIWIIGVNSIHNPKRQRFTIAHELGHFYMHKDKNIDFEDTTFFRNTDNSSIEYAANEFAANLLMPEDTIRKAIQDGIKNIEDLSSLFNVSIAAIKYRVLSLGYKLKSWSNMKSYKPIIKLDEAEIRALEHVSARIVMSKEFEYVNNPSKHFVCNGSKYDDLLDVYRYIYDIDEFNDERVDIRDRLSLALLYLGRAIISLKKGEIKSEDKE